MKLAGIDIGTTTISGIVWDSEKKEQLYACVLPNQSQIPCDESWRKEQDPEQILSLCIHILDEIREKVGNIDGIGVTGQMHGIVYLNDKGRHVSNLITWQDGRGDLLYGNEKKYYQRLSELTEHPMATGYGLTTYYHDTVERCVPANAVKICTISDYVAMRLTGINKPLIHPSNAASLGLYDIRACSFEFNKIAAAGMNVELLPKVSKSEAFIGRTVHDEPVSVAIGDNQASYLGSTEEQKDTILINIGTGSQISIAVDNCEPFITELEYRPYIRGKYLLLGSALCGGSAYGYLKNFFREFFQIMSDADVYKRMEKLAWQAYKSKIDQIVVDTRFAGTRCDPAIKGSFTEVSVTNFRPGFFVLGVLKGICDELYSYYCRFPSELRKRASFIGSGNAIRMNSLLKELIEIRFSGELKIAPYKEEAAYGAALVTKMLLDN